MKRTRLFDAIVLVCMYAPMHIKSVKLLQMAFWRSAGESIRVLIMRDINPGVVNDERRRKLEEENV